jgi:hypothetical protein
LKRIVVMGGVIGEGSGDVKAAAAKLFEGRASVIAKGAKRRRNPDEAVAITFSLDRFVAALPRDDGA